MPHSSDQGTLQSVLLSDVVCALNPEPCDDSSRRTAMRTIFSALEGLLWALQSELLNAARHELSASQRFTLCENAHVLREAGKVGRVPTVSLKERFTLTASAIARLHPDYKLNFDEAGWQALLSSLDVQDRLTQPENRFDLDVTHIELQAALTGQVWFLDNIVAAVQTDCRRSPHSNPPTSSPREGAFDPRLRELPVMSAPKCSFDFAK